MDQLNAFAVSTAANTVQIDHIDYLSYIQCMAKGSLKLRAPRVASKAVTKEKPKEISIGARVTVTATEAKNGFGPLLEKAIQGRSVVITKHDRPKAVLLSVAEFEALVSRREPSLAALTEEFDSLLARMQSTSSRRGLETAFNASPEELGRLAVAHAKRRG
jgi:antitoxin Phd